MATAAATRSAVKIALVLDQKEADWLRRLTGLNTSELPVNTGIFEALKPLTEFKLFSHFQQE